MNLSCSIHHWCSRCSHWPIRDSSCALASYSNSSIGPYSEELSCISMGQAELPARIGVGRCLTGACRGEGVGLQITRGTGDPDLDLLATSSTLSHYLLSCSVMALNIQSYLRALNLSHYAPIDHWCSWMRTSRSQAALISNWRCSHDLTARGLPWRQLAMSCWTQDSNM